MTSASVVQSSHWTSLVAILVSSTACACMACSPQTLSTQSLIVENRSSEILSTVVVQIVGPDINGAEVARIAARSRTALRIAAGTGGGELTLRANTGNGSLSGMCSFKDPPFYRAAVVTVDENLKVS